MRLAAWAVATTTAPVVLSGAFLAGTPPPPPSALQLCPSTRTGAGAAVAATTPVVEVGFRRSCRDRPVAATAATAAAAAAGGGSGEFGLTRSGLVKAAAAAAFGAGVAATSTVSPASATGNQEEPQITSKCFIEVRIMEPLNEANGYSSKNAFKGKLVFGVYGEACPKAAENFLRYVRADRSNGEPSYASGQLTKMEPGVFLEGGKIAGLNVINIGGQEELEYGGEVLAALPSLLEASSVELKHDRRGLLTRDRLSRGPEFGVTLGAAPGLDGSHEVFGRLLQGEDVLARLGQVPVYGGQNRLEEGSLASDAFKAQNRALVYIGKNVFRDERAVDRTGSLMRRVDILNCGVL
ncbi:unnamed protein product [Pylaiella littoralis]